MNLETAVERGSKEAGSRSANAAVGQSLHRGGIGGGRGSPNRVHVEAPTP